jgi:hypothetical protein
MDSKTLDAQAEIPLLEFMNRTAGMATNKVVAAFDPVASMTTWAKGRLESDCGKLSLTHA